mmetsp:Transcript_710/g.2936  ORF Transcript_710/g.2936 Transcript_710/m.2936 type:complete len:243 (+) Transcript_710:205-933(+)
MYVSMAEIVDAASRKPSTLKFHVANTCNTKYTPSTSCVESTRPRGPVCNLNGGYGNNFTGKPDKAHTSSASNHHRPFPQASAHGSVLVEPPTLHASLQGTGATTRSCRKVPLAMAVLCLRLSHTCSSATSSVPLPLLLGALSETVVCSEIACVSPELWEVHCASQKLRGGNELDRLHFLVSWHWPTSSTASSATQLMNVFLMKTCGWSAGAAAGETGASLPWPNMADGSNTVAWASYGKSAV